MQTPPARTLAGRCPRRQAPTAGEPAGRRLRPDRLPSVPGADLAVRHQPDGDSRTGTAFSDAFAAGAGRWRLVAGHVGGHVPGGPPAAAALAELARRLLRTAAGDTGPAAAIDRLDGLVEDLGRPALPLGAVCVDLVRQREAFLLVAARVAHRPPLVMRATGAVLAVRVPGGGSGRAAWPEPAELAVELQPGDTVLLCTGGATPGEPVGDPRFSALLAGCAARPPQAVLDHLGRALADRWAPAAPGASFLALRVRGGRVRAAAPAWPPD